jgi:hypothetical protein
MKETKFTPGPWEWDGNVWDYEYYNEAPWLEGKDGRVVLSGQIRCSTEANAHLIAAAPELYDAVKELLYALQDDENWRTSGVYEDAESALAKARGET